MTLRYFNGEELREDYYYVPLACAGELLSYIEDDLQDLALKMHKKISKTHLLIIKINEFSVIIEISVRQNQKLWI